MCTAKDDKKYKKASQSPKLLERTNHAAHAVNSPIFDSL